MSRCGLGACALAVGAAVALGAAVLGPAAELEVAAPLVPAGEAPVLDGRQDAVWDKGLPVRFTVGEGSQGTVEVTLWALRTESHLYLLVHWPDRTESLNRAFELTERGWRPARGREDRLNIAWEMAGSVPEFAARGCALLCHKTEGVMRTTGPAERIDLWYWMAQRTNPLGVMDDWVMAHEPASVEGARTGRRPDAPAGGPYESNWDEARRRPRYMARPGTRSGSALLRTEAVEVPATARFRVGDRLPREVLAPPAGPRAGIEARGRWQGGAWTVEIRRRLATGDPDDVQFTGPGPYLFAVSIHDDAEKDEHAQMGRDVLRLRLP